MSEAFFRKLRALQLARTDLKPCPFCGGKAILVFENAWAGVPERHFAACTDCGCRTPTIMAETFDHTVNKWVAVDSAGIAFGLWERRIAAADLAELDRKNEV